MVKVGFDLDGVLLYNPARLVRPLVSGFKHIVIPKKEHTFYIPRSKPEQALWNFLHLSSIFPASGWHDIKQLVDEKKIDAYVVTARFGFMKPDIDRWMKILNKEGIFTDIIYNVDYKQPQLHKEEVIKKLGLEIFVEDNWDIVKHLFKTTNARTYWVYNIFDRQIKYQYKAPNLKQIVNSIKEYSETHS